MFLKMLIAKTSYPISVRTRVDLVSWIYCVWFPHRHSFGYREITLERNRIQCCGEWSTYVFFCPRVLL